MITLEQLDMWATKLEDLVKYVPEYAKGDARDLAREIRQAWVDELRREAHE